MTDPAPTRVVLYSYGTGAPAPAAEFRWQQGESVSLTVLDPAWSAVAEDWFAHGVPVPAEQRRITPDDAPAFMQALLRPLNATYYGFVDESGGDAPPPTGRSPMDGQEARAIAERALDETVRPANPDVVIVDRHTRESGDSWVFVYDNRAYVETGAFEERLVGNAPLFVDKATGHTRFGRTDIGVDEQL